MTLIEMMIVISIVATAAAIIGINATKLIQDINAFRTGTEVILDKLQMAQNIMLIFKSETYVTLERKKDGLLCHIETGNELPESIEKAINLACFIPGIESAVFIDEQKTRQHNKIILTFSSMNMRIPHGTLILSGGKQMGSNPLQKEVYLTGYPSPIGIATKTMLTENTAYESEILFPQEIRQDWLQKNQSKP